GLTRKSRSTTVPQLSQAMTSHGCFAVIAAVTFGQNHTDGHISLALQLAIPDWNSSLVDSLFQTLLPPDGFTIV
ncbi:MAG: hypothetical protein WCD60_15495, partial [Pseudolabrys sp.]